MPKRFQSESASPVNGVKTRIKKLILKDPSITAEGIVDKLSKNGAPAPSKFMVTTIRQEFRHSLKVLKDEGLLDIDF